MTVLRDPHAPCGSGCSAAADYIPSVCFVKAVPAPPIMPPQAHGNSQAYALLHSGTQRVSFTSGMKKGPVSHVPILTRLSSL